MVQIVVILHECHRNWYWQGELADMSKDCFYVGLLPKNRPMVVHLKDQSHTTPLDLLRALLEQAENRYHHQPHADKRNDRYMVHPTQLDAEPSGEEHEADAIFPSFFDDDDVLKTWYNDRFLIGLRQAAEISKYCNGRCCNCQKEGHHWCQCKEPLSPELQELADKQDQACKEHEQKTLNLQGGARVKEGCTPAPLVGANPAVPQAAGAPAL